VNQTRPVYADENGGRGVFDDQREDVYEEAEIADDYEPNPKLEAAVGQQLSRSVHEKRSERIAALKGSEGVRAGINTHIPFEPNFELERKVLRRSQP